MRTKIVPILMALLFCPIMALAALTDRKDVQEFMTTVQKQYGLTETELTAVLNQARIEPKVLAAIAKPYEAKPWHQYEKLFITDFHVQQGVHFWKTHAKTLNAVEKKYGIPPEMIVAIIGIETKYGKNLGNFRVLDALTTLSFEYPPRSAFFKQELAHFLVLMKEEGWTADDVRGSYAGAFGMPQFIPSSYRHYAVDFSGAGKRDIVHNTDNAIASVAHYFHQHGWQPNEPVAIPTTLLAQSDIADVLADPRKPKPSLLGHELRAKGIHVPHHLTAQPLSVMGFEQPDNSEYWLGFQNFYVITRYNHSQSYAMAAYQLSQKLKVAYAQGQAS
ncbi:MAG: lytic murein transglycosylase B [Pseudomonadota bacterium]